ncbi:MAG: hypothetical protein GXO31_07965 [Epsilonproteobacteria bacterium]|nr:hypothetical protein [Campylobacterota bacterium]
MHITIDRDKYIKELRKAIKEFYEAKAIGNKNKIKYYKGFSEGIMLILLKMRIITEEELKQIIKEEEEEFENLETTPIYEKTLRDLDTPSIFRKMKGFKIRK